MDIQVLSISNKKDIAASLRDIGVHQGGIKIMADKAVNRLIKVKHVPSWAANILKQEILSLNGDVAINEGAITGKVKFTDCLIMGNVSQISQFIEKLERQPPALRKIASEIKGCLEGYESKQSVIFAKNHKINLGRRTLLMAVVNLTPDSFSGDGLLGKMPIDFIERHIEGLIKDGADIIDIGGESSRPGAKEVSLKEELSRTIPVIKRLAKKTKIPISIDTYKPEVAQRAMDAGASIINNIRGAHNDLAMLKVMQKSSAAVVLMHMKGTPKTMQKKPSYDDLMGEIISSLKNSIDIAVSKGIKRERIIVDPGIGFGKTVGHNLEIIKRLSELKSLGRPILIGPSRKSFIGKILNLSAEDRIMGTAASVAAAILNGASIVRVHDCRLIKQVVELTGSILYN